MEDVKKPCLFQENSPFITNQFDNFAFVPSYIQEKKIWFLENDLITERWFHYNVGFSSRGDYTGLKSFNGQKVYSIDDIPTIITEVHNNVAKGYILQNDFTFEPCTIVKEDNIFAHGETLHKAVQSLQKKLYQKYPIETRIAKFKEQYPDFNKKIPAIELFVWHNRLTGSCEMGRMNFVRNHNIDLHKDEFTVNEFIELTKDSYNGDIIEMLR